MWTALAHGKRGEAAQLARARPSDPTAAAVLGRLASDSGQYDEALEILEPVAAKAPMSDAALELALLHQRLGRAEAAEGLLVPLFNQGSSDPASTLRAARAAQALGRAREANSLSGARARRRESAGSRGGGGARDCHRSAAC
jgi:tetratricopeptide (TPR) repeat protein